MRKILISMSIICTSLTVRTQPSPRFHVKSVVTFQNCEMAGLFISLVLRQQRMSLPILAAAHLLLVVLSLLWVFNAVTSQHVPNSGIF